MIVSAPRSGRTGNQMFQWGFASILSKLLGVPLAATPLDWFPNTVLKWPYCDLINPLIIKDSGEPMEKIIERCAGRHVITNGGFEWSPYFIPFRKELREWFGFVEFTPRSIPVVFHFRGTDFAGKSNWMDDDYYTRAWSILGRPRDVVICTDDLGDKGMLGFCATAGFSPPSKLNDPMDDFLMMLSAERLVIPRSTFSWWAGFLGCAEVIQAVPIRDEFLWRNLSVPGWFQLHVKDHNT